MYTRQKYYCDHHGANGSHDTRDCNVLRHSGPSTSSRGSTVARRGALAAAQRSTPHSARWDEPRHAPSNHPIEHQSRQPYCEYCNGNDHYEDRCLIQHPSLAPPGWLPPRIALQNIFLENRARAASLSSGKQASAPNVPRLGTGSPRVSEPGSVSGSQPRRVNVTTASNLDDDFEEEDYAPSDLHGTASVTCSHCFATLLQQPQPLPFEAAEIRPDVYPPPKVPSRSRDIPNPSGPVVSMPLVDVVSDIANRLQQLLAALTHPPDASPLAPHRPAASAATPPVASIRLEAQPDVAPPTAVHAAVSITKGDQDPTPAPQQCQSRRGVSYSVKGAYQASTRGIQDIPNHEKEHLYFRNPEAAAYFREAQHLSLIHISEPTRRS